MSFRCNCGNSFSSFHRFVNQHFMDAEANELELVAVTAFASVDFPGAGSPT
jgi:hypothetical protein